jgi:hypothetical protein
MTILDEIADEVAWLKKHPDFDERPASIEQFLGPQYLNIRSMVRDRLIPELVAIFGEEPNPYKIAKYEKAIFTGGIGTGKSTLASIALCYMVHWLLCLKNPQKFFNLLPGSRIAVMMMSTSGEQAKGVIYGDIRARVDNGPWFQRHPYDKKYMNQIRFHKDVAGLGPQPIWIIPGDSAETTFEGYNILCGILDEIDSHKLTTEKDYAEQGYNTIRNRVTSRFDDRGFVFCVGQMKSEGGFAWRHYEEFKKDPTAYAVKLTIWESKGWDHFLNSDGTRNSFYYDLQRKKIYSKEIGDAMGGPSEDLLEVPQVYRREFETDPIKALRDLAGIPPSSLDPFITQTYKIDDSYERWKEFAFETWGTDELPCDGPRLAEWFHAPNTVHRFAHIDVGVTGDALGLAVGHTPGVIQVADELKPRIVIDLAMRITAPPGGEIDFNEVRHILYTMRDVLKFNFKLITQDSYQSTDNQQQLTKRRFKTDILSMDKEVIPYYDLREALNEDRLDMPAVMAVLKLGENPVNVLKKELMELRDLGAKIDHPLNGSKDVADAVAGVVHNVMRTSKVRRIDAGIPTSMDRTLPTTDPPRAAQRRGGSGSVLGRPAMPWRPPTRRGGF